MIDNAAKRAELIAALKSDLSDYVQQEKTRLILERTFLKSVLENSLMLADAKAIKYEYSAVVQDVTEFLGMRSA